MIWFKRKVDEKIELPRMKSYKMILDNDEEAAALAVMHSADAYGIGDAARRSLHFANYVLEESGKNNTSAKELLDAYEKISLEADCLRKE